MAEDNLVSLEELEGGEGSRRRVGGAGRRLPRQLVIIVLFIVVLCVDLALQHILQPVLQLLRRGQVLLVIHLHPHTVRLGHTQTGLKAEPDSGLLTCPPTLCTPSVPFSASVTGQENCSDEGLG